MDGLGLGRYITMPVGGSYTTMMKFKGSLWQTIAVGPNCLIKAMLEDTSCVECMHCKQSFMLSTVTPQRTRLPLDVLARA